MQVVSLQAQPNQTVTVTLNGQPCQIDVRTRRTGLFLNLWLGGALTVAGALCQDRNPVVRAIYPGFVGDLMWLDLQGTSDPTWDGIGTRFLLCYLTSADFP